jgi:indole-3-glycerol phosphate synthase
MLDTILAHKPEEVAHRRRAVPLTALRDRAAAARPTRGFRAALARPGLALIAEVKQRSPSRGTFRTGFAPLELARAYAANGARAVSVLADEQFFGGGPEVVRQVANDEAIGLPVLWKDFVIDPYQVHEARAAGADAVLLIVRATAPELFRDLVALARELGLDALVETFVPEEVEQALEAGADLVGINNRDLGTFGVDLGRSARMRALLPAGVVSVSESGLGSRADLLEAERQGFDAVLVGEALLRGADVGARVRELLGT